MHKGKKEIKAINLLSSNLSGIALGVSKKIVKDNKEHFLWRIINLFDNYSLFKTKDTVTDEIIFFHIWLVDEWAKKNVDDKVYEYLSSHFFWEVEHDYIYKEHLDYEKYQVRRKEYDEYVKGEDKRSPQNKLVDIICKELKKYDNTTKSNIIEVINQGMHELSNIMKSFVAMNTNSDK